MSPVRCQNLSKLFRGVRAVNRVNLEVPEGAIYGLVGPNGAGKTTAIKMMMNLIPPDEGRVEILGCDSRSLGPAEFAMIGYASENQQMPDWMTVGYLMRYLKPFYPTWDDTRADELIREFDLPKNRRIRHLSRGMWMKTALASSLAYRPRLLILDEPFSGLDPLVRDELIQGILNSADETTIVCSSHDLAEIETLASHIGYMERGVLHFSEEMTALSSRFREVEVTLSSVPLTPVNGNWPKQWLKPEISPSLIRFIDTAFDAEGSEAKVRRIFDGVTHVTAHPMPLRSIFLAMARSHRA